MTPKQRTKPKPKISEYDREAAANAVEFASSENLEITAMTLEDALTEFVATHNLAPQQLELAQRLVWVEEIGVSEHYDRSEMHDYMMEHYDRLFGPLRRPKSEAVPSDFLRKSWMISELLDLAETRRDEYAAERAACRYQGYRR